MNKPLRLVVVDPNNNVQNNQVQPQIQSNIQNNNQSTNYNQMQKIEIKCGVN